jgi:acyl-CoA reductase-like NAD-dependent aldehyde dehydrogenase
MEGVCLELGGKDPAYVRADADVDYAAVEIADGAAFNSGQSCCAIERVYVHEKAYDVFVEKIVAELRTYKLGDPKGTSLLFAEADGGDANTTIGPVVSSAAAARIRKQVSDALAEGAKAEIPLDTFPLDKEGSTFVGPQVLTNVTHKMSTFIKFGAEWQVSCEMKRSARSSGS